jgi:hypothetical protein
MVTNFDWLLFCLASHHVAFIPRTCGLRRSNLRPFFAFGPYGAFIPGALALRRGARNLSGSVFCVWASHAAFILAALAPLPGRTNLVALFFAVGLARVDHPGSTCAAPGCTKIGLVLVFAFGPVTVHLSMVVRCAAPNLRGFFYLGQIGASWADCAAPAHEFWSGLFFASQSPRCIRPHFEAASPHEF